MDNVAVICISLNPLDMIIGLGACMMIVAIIVFIVFLIHNKGWGKPPRRSR
jgi:hypothetical protein